MKLLLLISLSVLLPGPAYGQEPRVGIIDFYGLRSLSERRARQALQIKEGDPFPASREEAQRRLEALPNVRQALLNLVCCEGGKSILYVGVREKGARSLQFRRAPKGAVRLPETMLRARAAFEEALGEAVLKGDPGEDRSQGHALNSYPKMRAVQEQFIAFAAHDFKLLRDVLRESADAGHRALAAEVIGYAADRREVVKELAYGMSDPDGDVRNNSMRALAVLAGFAQRHPERRIEVPVEPFIDMLNSVVWTDRNKSSMALSELTEKRDPAILSKLRERALPSLVEMSRWKSLGHASYPLTLLGRVGNLPEDEILKAKASAGGDREALIEEVLRRVRANRRRG
jgi:hypothetical protein